MSAEDRKSGEQKEAESDVDRFRKRLGPFVVAAETTRMPMVFTNAREEGEPIIFANDSFLSLVGYRREQVLGESFRSLMTRGADAEAQAKIEEAFGRESEDDPEICFRRQDGSQFWASLFISPVRDDGGEVVQHFVSLVNLTKHRQEQDRLRFLLEELNHRTQNTLATVLAIAGQTLRGMADAKAIKALESRILALSRTHSLLGTEDWDSVGLRDMLDQVLEPFSSTDIQGARFLMEGDNIRLQPKAALTLTLVLHELATNAVEHGALANDTGQIAISWQMETGAPPRMRLRWRERGGPAVIPPVRKGFGSRLVENGLAHDNAEAHLAYEPAGVICELVMPIGALGRMSDE